MIDITAGSRISPYEYLHIPVVVTIEQRWRRPDSIIAVDGETCERVSVPIDRPNVEVITSKDDVDSPITIDVTDSRRREGSFAPAIQYWGLAVPNIAGVAALVERPLDGAGPAIEGNYAAVLTTRLQRCRTDADHHLNNPVVVDIGHSRTRVDRRWRRLRPAQLLAGAGHSRSLPLQAAVRLVRSEFSIAMAEDDFVATVGVNVRDYRR